MPVYFELLFRSTLHIFHRERLDIMPMETGRAVLALGLSLVIADVLTLLLEVVDNVSVAPYPEFLEGQQH